MTRWAAIMLTAAIVLCVPAAGALAQTPAPPTATEPITARPDRTTADKATRAEMARKRAALKQKRIDCRKQASAQGLHLIKRSRFIKQCMAG